MGKVMSYDVLTGKYELVEVEDIPVIEEEKVEHQPTIEEQIEEINYTLSLLPADIQMEMIKKDIENQNKRTKSVNKILSGVTVYNMLTNIIKDKGCETKEEALKVIDIYYTYQVLNSQQYTELVELANQVYGG